MTFVDESNQKTDRLAHAAFVCTSEKGKKTRDYLFGFREETDKSVQIDRNGFAVVQRLATSIPEGIK